MIKDTVKVLIKQVKVSLKGTSRWDTIEIHRIDRAKILIVTRVRIIDRMITIMISIIKTTDNNLTLLNNMVNQSMERLWWCLHQNTVISNNKSKVISITHHLDFKMSLITNNLIEIKDRWEPTTTLTRIIVTLDKLILNHLEQFLSQMDYF